MLPIVVQKARKFCRGVLLCLLNPSAQRDSPGSAHNSLLKSVTWPHPSTKGGMQYHHMSGSLDLEILVKWTVEQPQATLLQTL